MNIQHFSISLDPDEDVQDPDLFVGLAKFVDDDLGQSERELFFKKTIPRMVDRAKALRATKPPHGLYFSLQQQGENPAERFAPTLFPVGGLRSALNSRKLDFNGCPDCERRS